MKDRPMLFSSSTVRALLDGRKTQTRRVVEPQPTSILAQPGEGKVPSWAIVNHAPATGVCVNAYGNEDWLRCPYGQPGDRLWVRESWKAHTTFDHLPPRDIPASHVWYLADNGYKAQSRTRASIHMPRWASRILLEIVSVRVERLQDISEADAKAEGVIPREVRQFAIFGASATERAAIYRDAAVEPYCELWQQINGADSWDANPWVWAVEFQRVAP